MILDEYVDVKMSNSHLKYYQNLGYKCKKQGEIIKIKPKDLPNGSTIKINCKCEFCGQDKNTQYRYHLKSVNNNGKYKCLACISKDNLGKYNKRSDLNELTNELLLKNVIPLDLDNQYKNKHSYIDFECAIHRGLPQNKMVQAIKNSDCPCDYCNPMNLITGHSSKCNTFDDAKEYIYKKTTDYTIFEIEKYIDENSELMLICNKCNNIKILSINQIRALSSIACFDCNIESKRKEIDYYQNLLSEIHGHIIIKDITFETNQIMMLCYCINHEEYFTKAWSKLKNAKCKGCEKCISESKRGENNAMWKEDREEFDRIRNRVFDDNSQSIWRAEILKRCNWRCELSNKRGKLNAHHLNGYHWDVENRFNTNNGVCLLVSIHKLFHKLYGNKHNTKEQFEEFTIRYNLGEFGFDFK